MGVGGEIMTIAAILGTRAPDVTHRATAEHVLDILTVELHRNAGDVAVEAGIESTASVVRLANVLRPPYHDTDSRRAS